MLFVLPTLVLAGNPFEGVETKQVSREEAKNVKGKGRWTRFIAKQAVLVSHDLGQAVGKYTCKYGSSCPKPKYKSGLTKGVVAGTKAYANWRYGPR